MVGIAKAALETAWHGPRFMTFEIVIPEGVVYLEQGAFEDCCHATTIYLPSTLRVIPEDCFANVTAEIVFPNGNPNFVVTDGFLIAQESSTLLYAAPSSYNVSLPLVKRLGNSSLDNWLYERTEVILPSTLESIGEFVFYDVVDISHIALPNSVKHIDSRAFFCTGLKTVVLPTELTEIPAYCFCDCSISSIIIPNGVTHIGEYAIYRNWEEIETVILPTTVQFVGYNAFPEETYGTQYTGELNEYTLEWNVFPGMALFEYDESYKGKERWRHVAYHIGITEEYGHTIIESYSWGKNMRMTSVDLSRYNYYGQLEGIHICFCNAKENIPN